MENPVPNITSLDLLKSLYQELSAPFASYYKTILVVSYRDGSSDTEEIVIHGPEGVPQKLLERSSYPGARKVVIARTFVEETCGSLYAPVSALGYRSFSYDWALVFVIDCDIARRKTGSPEDGASCYISDVAADDKILKRRAAIENYYPRKRSMKTNTQDMEDRYLLKTKTLTSEERKEISEFLKANKKQLNSVDNFKHEDYKSPVDAKSISISAGPDDLDDENFLSWLLEQAEQPTKTSKKSGLDETDSN